MALEDIAYSAGDVKYSIGVDQQLGPVVVIEDSGRRYEPTQRMPMTQLLGYSRELLKLWESKEGIKGDTLSSITRIEAELSAAKATNTTNLGKTFADILEISMPYVFAKGYEALKAKQNMLGRYEDVAKGETTLAKMARGLGKNYHTAASNHRNRDYLDKCISKVADDTGLNGMAVVRFLHQGYSAYETPVTKKTSGRFTDPREIRRKLMPAEPHTFGAGEPPGKSQQTVVASKSDFHAFERKISAGQEGPPGVGVEPDLSTVTNEPGPGPAGDIYVKETQPMLVRDLQQAAGIAGDPGPPAAKPPTPPEQAPAPTHTPTPDLVQRVNEEPVAAAGQPTKPYAEPPEAPEKPKRESRLSRRHQKKRSRLGLKIAFSLAAILGLAGAPIVTHAYAPGTRPFLESYLGRAVEVPSNALRRGVDYVRNLF